MKEKIVFLIRNVFTRKFYKIFNIEKKITFNFNFIETVSGNLLLLDRIKFLEENLNNTIVDLEFDESPEVQVIKNLPENDFQGRIFELISGSHREQLAAKTEAGSSLIEYKIHCRNTYLNFKSIVGKKQGGTYGIEKIDGVDSEKEKFILDAYAEELLAKVKIFEIKTSRTGDLKGSMKSALKDVTFNCNREEMIKYLQQHYKMSDIRDHTEIEKVFSYWGLSPFDSQNIPLDLFLKDHDMFEKFLKIYEKELLEMIKSSVSEFDLNFFSKEHFPSKEKLLALAEQTSETLP